MTTNFPGTHKRNKISLLNEAIGYQHIIEMAKILARHTGQVLMDRTHLILAIFSSPSDDIKRILRNTGIEQDKALLVFEESFPWFAKIHGTLFLDPTKTENEHQRFLNALRLELLTLVLDLPAVAPTKASIRNAKQSRDRSVVSDHTASVKELNLSGIKLLASRLYEEAMAQFEKALSQDAENVTASNGKGYCLLEFDGTDEAGGLFERVLNQDPIDLAALVGKGICLIKRRHLVPATAYFDRALAVHPRIPSLWYHRAKCYTGNGNPEKTLQCFYQALELFVSQQRKDEALIAVNESLESFPSDIRLRQFEGLIMRLGGSEETDLLKSKQKQETLYRDMKASDPEIEGPLAGTYKRLWSINPIKYTSRCAKSRK